MTTRTRKALAYITSGPDLLVFTHPFQPGAGVQVPAGTIEPGEEPRVAAEREAVEESGLRDLIFQRALGRSEYDMHSLDRDEIQERFFFHFTLSQARREGWRHYEAHSQTGGDPIALDFYWQSLRSSRIDLIAGQGEFLAELRRLLRLEGGN